MPPSYNGNYFPLRKSNAEGVEGIDALQLVGLPDGANHANIIQLAKQALKNEAEGIIRLQEELGSDFLKAVNMILLCQAKVIVTGIGKSGIIARKIASTLSSTGSPSIFLHPAEASHGDLGMIGDKDVVMAISKSGEAPELGNVLHYCRRFRIPVIAITVSSDSTLAQYADCLLLLPDIKEACPLGLAPTTSTIMTLALGDAIAIACLNVRDFKAAKFHEYHPGGKLGQKLIRVKDIMHTGQHLPLVLSCEKLSDAILEMTRARFGCVGILDQKKKLIGIFTDGDLRRHLSVCDMSSPIINLMSTAPQRVSPDAFLSDVAYLFTEKKIPSVFACIEDDPVGIIHVHDLLQVGYL